MDMTRRGFLGAILLAGAAPAIVRADSLMRIVVPRETPVLGMSRDFWTSPSVFHVDVDIIKIVETGLGLSSALVMGNPAAAVGYRHELNRQMEAFLKAPRPLAPQDQRALDSIVHMHRHTS